MLTLRVVMWFYLGVLFYWKKQSRQSYGDHFHSLSDCALCSLPLFLMLSGCSQNPPLTPLDATSCGGTKARVCSFETHNPLKHLDSLEVIVSHLRWPCGWGALWAPVYPWTLARWNPGWSWQRSFLRNLEVSDDPYWSDWWSYGF